MYRFATLLLLLLLLIPHEARSQASEMRDEMLVQFQRSSEKVLSLAAAMPEDLYSWSTGEGLMTVAQVYAHIARYNFMYLEDQLGVPTPEDLDLDRLEELTDKALIGEVLQRSVDHVREHLPELSEEDLKTRSTLYGRDVAGWAVLVQLVAHLNEHVGQSVAYARINGVVPPWSR
jgi:uncharacterized damage-inducible protein DinB